MKFPEPGDLSRIAPEIHVLPASTLLFRVYFQGGAWPTTWDRFRAFGPTGSRFDHHLPPPRTQERAVMYAALDAVTCIAEVFQDTRLVDRERGAPALVAFESVRDLRLLDLTGTWPTRAGASMAINTGPRSRARRWAVAIHAAYPEVDGVLYASSMHANRPQMALWERATDAVPVRPRVNRRLDDPAMLARLVNAAANLGYALR